MCTYIYTSRGKMARLDSRRGLLFLVAARDDVINFVQQQDVGETLIVNHEFCSTTMKKNTIPIPPHPSHLPWLTFLSKPKPKKKNKK